MKKITAIFLVALLALSLCLTASAAATIDYTQTASLSLYKYDITSAERDGVWSTGSYVSSGVEDQDGVNAILGNTEIVNTLPNGETSYGYAIKGVEFTYLKVAEVRTITLDSVVQTVYGFDGDGFVSKLGLTADNAVTAVGSVLYFTSDELNRALASAVADNPVGTANTMEAFVLENGGTAMSLTDENGYASAAELPLGLYLLAETKVPEYVTTTTAPFFVSLPMTTLDGDDWNYDVTVYPKNQTGKPTLEKLVRESVLSGGKTEEYAHIASGSISDVLDYKITSRLPIINSTATYLTDYTFVDTLGAGMTYKEDTVTVSVDGEAFVLDEDYTVVFAGNTMTIAMTDAGFAKINPAYSGCEMVITYSVTVNNNAVIGDKGNDNSVTLTWRRTSDTYFDTLTDCCHAFTWGIDLTKKFSDNKGDFAEVEFILQNATDGKYITAANVTAAEGEADVKEGYYVTGYADTADLATRLTPNALGKLMIYGVEDDAYILTEVSTDGDYILLSDEIDVVIGAAASTDVCTVCTGAKLTATGTVNTLAATMAADGESTNALLTLSVTNNARLPLPDTGESGVWMLCIVGVLALAGGIYLIVPKKRKN